MLKFSYEHSGLVESDLELIRKVAARAEDELSSGTGEGNEFLGWRDLPNGYLVGDAVPGVPHIEGTPSELEDIIATAEKIRAESEVFLVCGIGGSYLGARAGIEFLQGSGFGIQDPEIIFVGNNISSDYLHDILEYIKDKSVSLNVISKSGTTLEPALAFRFLRKFMEEKYGDKAKERIYVTTDKEKGVLKSLANEKGYKSFVVPDDVGGRFSVLTAVGLLPLAVQGANLYKLLQGAQNAMNNNGIIEYAMVRQKLADRRKPIEVLVSYEPYLQVFTEWWKQLFGESEGKDGKGIFPAGMIFTTDLHSLGQYVQDGQRIIFETVIKIKNSRNAMVVPHVGDIVLDVPRATEDGRPYNETGDGLDFLEGRSIDFVQNGAFLGTQKAHVAGGVPNLLIEIDERNEETLGELFYFFEKACAISSYMMGVNPFNQPGVESYKREMLDILKNN